MPPGRGFVGELRAGYRFLRSEPTLLANTVQASVAQLTVGVLNSPDARVHAALLPDDDLRAPRRLVVRGDGIGAGNLIGGFVIGLVGMRFAKGRMIIAGYAVWGFLRSCSPDRQPADWRSGCRSGRASRTWSSSSRARPCSRSARRHELMGRVVGFRFAAVFGSMTVAMVFGGMLAEFIGPDNRDRHLRAHHGRGVGLGGLLVPAVRDA